MTLTEQLKKGELEQGYYYMQIPTGDIRIITECMKVDCKGFSILSKVPSYEEWLENESHCAVYSDINKQLSKENAQLRKFLEGFNALDVAQENQQLKELLKECGRQLEEVELCRYDVADVDQEDWFRISTEQAGIAKKMKTKIDDVLK